MPNDLTKVTSLTELGVAWKSTEWPQEFEHEGLKWQKDHATVAADGDVQCVEYTTKDEAGRRWLIIVNE